MTTTSGFDVLIQNYSFFKTLLFPEGRSNIACTVSLLTNVQLDSYFRHAALISTKLFF